MLDRVVVVEVKDRGRRGGAARTLRGRARARPRAAAHRGSATSWRSVSKNTRGSPPVIAELWNTGFVADGVMKVSSARTSAVASGEVPRARLAEPVARAAWVIAWVMGGLASAVAAAA